MRAPAFWQRVPPHPFARLLAPLAALYGRFAGWRMGRVVEHSALPVICVGNFTVGGTGKTPVALAVAALLEEEGERPCFLTRGHGGSLRGPVAVDPATHDHREAGDEPLLLARAAPVIVSGDRPAGANLAGQTGATAIVMDDGFQNPALGKDLSLLLVDGAVGVMNGLCLPAGPLRAPLARQWEHADALIVMGEGAPGEVLAEDARKRGLPVFEATLVPDPQVVERLRGGRYLAFAGIGRPAKFFETLDRAGLDVAESRSFPDHHVYREQEIAELRARAQREGLRLITTEKDAVRLGAAEDIEVLPVTARIAENAALVPLLRRALRAP
ncbi:MAG: tetraacyldisaccharide 4'-kinase [Salinarimonas sp.]|nr:tetraacyldisaccharide 4'-kinase [Salinarimonas sp.]